MHIRSRFFLAPTLFRAPHVTLCNFLSRLSPNNRASFLSITPTRLFTPAASLGRDENREVDDYAELKEKVENLGICCKSVTPEEYTRLMCPKCKGGRLMERSLSFHMSSKRNHALWRCFNFECGWAGQIPHNSTASDGVHQLGRTNFPRILTEESLKLEPLGDILAAYFSKRMISKDTLKRNHVMQMAGDQIIIAFTYRQNSMLIGCKYRTLEKRFWQEKGTDKVLYGLDDVREADEIIIVEGEIDKLSVEEAGYRNCFSVPNGAPQSIASKELLPLEEDTRFSYLWNCKECLEKASRIVLATDGDLPGQVLAEELARRLGKERKFPRDRDLYIDVASGVLNKKGYDTLQEVESNVHRVRMQNNVHPNEYTGLLYLFTRCWQVCWPKKDELSSYKDANEVLVNLGTEALKEVIQCAVPYEMQNLN